MQTYKIRFTPEEIKEINRGLKMVYVRRAGVLKHKEAHKDPTSNRVIVPRRKKDFKYLIINNEKLEYTASKLEDFSDSDELEPQQQK